MTPATLLLISARKEDEVFARSLARELTLRVEVAFNRDEFRRILVTYPQAIVLWDADNEAAYESIGAILPKYAKPHRVFAITDSALERYPHLYRLPIFGHHLIRRSTPAALKIYTRLCKSALKETPVELTDFFDPGLTPQKLSIAKSTQKWAAIEAIQKVLHKGGIPSRLSALMAQATDELLINAIFIAPVEGYGKRPLKLAPRDQEVELKGRSEIEVNVMLGEDYVAVAVTDRWGSLEKKAVVDSLRQHFEEAFSTKRDPSSHLGIHGIVQNGLSLLLTSKSHAFTHAFLFLPRTENIREFRNEFRFVSLY